jgi:hypothetical protein
LQTFRAEACTVTLESATLIQIPKVHGIESKLADKIRGDGLGALVIASDGHGPPLWSARRL